MLSAVCTISGVAPTERRRLLRLLFVGAVAFAPGRALGTCPPAPTVVVKSADDIVDANPGDCKCETALNNGVCTLRAAVMEANRTTGATIQVPSGTYFLNRDTGLCASDGEGC